MISLIFLITTLALLFGFVALTQYEARRGMRFYPEARERLDAFVERIEFIYTQVNLGTFVKEEILHFVSRLGHDIAHLTLFVVRAVERLLTRLVRHLRTRPEIDQGSRETAREFVKTLSDFKNNLKATHPEIHDIS